MLRIPSTQAVARAGEGQPANPRPEPAGPEVGARPGREPVSATGAIVLAVSFGLCAGYLDVAIIVAKKLWWNPEG